MKGIAMKITKCKACGREIVFMKTRGGKFIPVNYEKRFDGDETFLPQAGHVAHFATCPEADRFRRRIKQKRQK